MMLEQSLINPNFVGKDGFRWFIGIVAKGIKRSIDDGLGYKVKVRIVGYHPESSNILSDDELPWAHVLVPLNFGAGESGTGISFNPRGSEYVIGFFLDGDNGQQPVIIGALFSGFAIEHLNSFNEGTNNLRPYVGDKTLLRNSNLISSVTGRVPNPSGVTTPSGNVGIGSTVHTSQGKEACLANFTVNIPPTCKSSNTTYSRIVQALRKFVKALRTVQQVSDKFIKPALNTLANIPALIQEVTNVLTDLFSSYVKFIRDLIVEKIYKLLKDFIESLIPKDLKLFKQLATEKIVDTIKCAFYKIIKKLGEFILNFLTNIANSVVSIPLCAVDALVGSVLSTVSQEITNAIGPALSEITSVLGGAIGTIDSYISKAISFITSAVSFLSCESAECKAYYDYEMNKGYIKSDSIAEKRFNSIINYPSVGIESGRDAAKKWLGITNPKAPDVPTEVSSSFGACDATVFECGLPTVEIFGGGGSGAAGLAVVDALGQVMGVNILSGGSGYSGAPFISITDSCENGRGAVGIANITNGVVTSVTMQNTGSGYLNSTTPGLTTKTSVGDVCNINPIDESGSEVVGYIVGVEILKTGVGYSNTDLISNTACSDDVEIYPIVDSKGRIVDVNIVNQGTAIRVYPELTINSDTGEGAEIRPILSFNTIKPITSELDLTKIERVVLCAENHG